MALAAYRRKKLQAVRDRITRDKRAVVEAANNGAAVGYATAKDEAAAEIEALRREIATAQDLILRMKASLQDALDTAQAIDAKRKLAESEAIKLSITATDLTAEVRRLKEEASVLRKDAADPRKAAILECIAVVKAERTVSRAVTALRAFLKG